MIFFCLFLSIFYGVDEDIYGGSCASRGGSIKRLHPRQRGHEMCSLTGRVTIKMSRQWMRAINTRIYARHYIAPFHTVHHTISTLSLCISPTYLPLYCSGTFELFPHRLIWCCAQICHYFASEYGTIILSIILSCCGLTLKISRQSKNCRWQREGILN